MYSKKENNPFVSVIIPVYNVEPYIERCFRSVISQTYRNYEIIFVDDCGTDRSIEILQRLIDEYNGDISLRLIHHKKNSGAAVSRNSGMDIACGEYYLFVDSDDFISSDCLSELIIPLSRGNYDVVIGKSTVITKNCAQETILPDNLPAGSIPLEFYFSSISCRMGGSASNRLYKASFLRSHNILFKANFLLEDIFFNIELFCKNPTFYYCKKSTYFYCIRENSVSTTRNETFMNDQIQCVELMEQLFSKHNLLDRKYVMGCLQQRYLRLLIISVDFGKEYFRKTFDYIRKRGFNKKEWSAIPFKHKLLYIQCLMPKTLAYIYTACFVWLYRTFIWKDKS